LHATFPSGPIERVASSCLNVVTALGCQILPVHSRVIGSHFLKRNILETKNSHSFRYDIISMPHFYSITPRK